MTKSKPVLGRGLASLIPRQPPSTPTPASLGRQDDGVSNEIIANIEIDKIRPNPYQPRAEFDAAALDELKRSILEKGIIQPVTVRRYEQGYQLISGERRVRAAREAGLLRLPAYIIRVHSDEEMLELALVENLQREHLNPIEIAISYKRLIDECRLTQEDVAERIGKDRTTVTNFLRLLKLPPEIQTALRKGELSGGHGRALVAIEDPKSMMAAFRRVMKSNLSVRDVEHMARTKGKKRQRTHQGSAGWGSGSLSSLEERLRQFLGTKVSIKMLREGRGEIVIEYYSREDLDRLLEILSDLQEKTR